MFRQIFFNEHKISRLLETSRLAAMHAVNFDAKTGIANFEAVKQLLRSYEPAILWLQKRLGAKNFLIFSCILVGSTAGLAAVVLKTAVHYIHLAITHDYHISFQYILYLLFPAAGLLITAWIVKKYLKGKLDKGTANVLYAIEKKAAFLPAHEMYSHIVTSAVTVGLGGSGGLESPIVVTGSAIGSNYSRTYHIAYPDRTLLLACGAAAGIAGAFNAPVAGVLFALEVLLTDVSISAFIPLIIASATGGLLSKIILNEDILLSFHLQQPFNYRNVPMYIVLGILAGAVSVSYTRTQLHVETFIERRKMNFYMKALWGGGMLALLIAVFPSLFGEGYNTIKILSDIKPAELFEHSIFARFITGDWTLLILVILALLLKPVAAAITIGAGGNGGNFAPSLFVGAYLGFAFATFINLTGISEAPVSNFTIVAMAGVLSGVFHAPLTGIFLIAEITGGYELMIPLMIVSAISNLIMKYFQPLSIDGVKLARRGHLITTDKDKSILSSLKILHVVETEFQTVPSGAKLRELVQTISHTRRNVFPVVNGEILVGVILLDDIREIMFRHEMYDAVSVNQLMRVPPAVVSLTEDMQSVMKKFDETGAWNLPVVSEGKYVGFVSKSSLFGKYRERLIRREG
jgi:CIC family chloride channel protein